MAKRFDQAFERSVRYATTVSLHAVLSFFSLLALPMAAWADAEL